MIDIEVKGKWLIAEDFAIQIENIIFCQQFNEAEREVSKVWVGEGDDEFLILNIPFCGLMEKLLNA